MMDTRLLLHLHRASGNGGVTACSCQTQREQVRPPSSGHAPAGDCQQRVVASVPQRRLGGSIGGHEVQLQLFQPLRKPGPKAVYEAETFCSIASPELPRPHRLSVPLQHAPRHAVAGAEALALKVDLVLLGQAGRVLPPLGVAAALPADCLDPGVRALLQSRRHRGAGRGGRLGVASALCCPRCRGLRHRLRGCAHSGGQLPPPLWGSDLWLLCAGLGGRPPLCRALLCQLGIPQHGRHPLRRRRRCAVSAWQRAKSQEGRPRAPAPFAPRR